MHGRSLLLYIVLSIALSGSDHHSV